MFLKILSHIIILKNVFENSRFQEFNVSINILKNVFETSRFQEFNVSINILKNFENLVFFIVVMKDQELFF